MEDLNSWLRRIRFSKTVYPLQEPNPLQIPIIPLTKLKLTTSKPNPHQASTTLSFTGDLTSKTSLESSPDIGLTGMVQVGFNSKTNKTGMAFSRKAISEMFKKAKEAVKRRLVASPPRERTGTKTVKSSVRPEKKSYWLKKYFGHEVRQVGLLDGSSEAVWTPDMYELIRWKKMASRVRCPIHRAIEESSEVDWGGHVKAATVKIMRGQESISEVIGSFSHVVAALFCVSLMNYFKFEHVLVFWTCQII